MKLLLLGALCALGRSAGEGSPSPDSHELQSAKQALIAAEQQLTERWGTTDATAKIKAAELLLQHRVQAWQDGAIVRAVGHEHDEAHDEKHYDMTAASWDSWQLKRVAIQSLASSIADSANADTVVQALRDATLEVSEGHWQLRVSELRDVLSGGAARPEQLVAAKTEIVQYLAGVSGEHGAARTAVMEIEREIRGEYEAKEQKKRQDMDTAAPGTYVEPTTAQRAATDAKILSETKQRVQDQLTNLVDFWAVKGTKRQMVVFHTPTKTVDSRVTRRMIGNQIKLDSVQIPLIFVSGTANGAAKVVHDLIRDSGVDKKSLRKRDGAAPSHATTRVVLVPETTGRMPDFEPIADDAEIEGGAIVYDEYVTHGNTCHEELREAIFVAMHTKTKLSLVGTGSMIAVRKVLPGPGSRPLKPLESLNADTQSGLRIVWQGRAQQNNGLFDHTSDWHDSPDAVLPRTKELAHFMTRVHAAFTAQTSSSTPVPAVDPAAAIESIYSDTFDAEKRLAVRPAFVDHVRIEGEPITVIPRADLLDEIEASVQMRALLEHLNNAEATFVGLPGAIAAATSAEIVDTLRKDGSKGKLYPLVAHETQEELRDDVTGSPTFGEVTTPRVYDLTASDTILGHLHQMYHNKYNVFNGMYGELVGNQQLYKIWTQEDQTALSDKTPEEQQAHHDEWQRNTHLENEWSETQAAKLHQAVEAAEKALQDAATEQREALQQALTTAREHYHQEVAKLSGQQLLIKTEKFEPEALFTLKRSVDLPEAFTFLYAFARQYFKTSKDAGRFRHVGMETSGGKVVAGSADDVWAPTGLVHTVISLLKTSSDAFQLVDAAAASKGIWYLAAPDQFKCPAGFEGKQGSQDTEKTGMSTGTLIGIIAAGIVGVSALGAGVYYGCA